VIVLSAYQVQHLPPLRCDGARSVPFSPDLGRSTVQAALDADGVHLPDGQAVTWDVVDAVLDAASGAPIGAPCFVVDGTTVSPARLHSAHTGRICSLVATRTAPTAVLAGFPMHRVKDGDPLSDTRAKLRAIAPVVGRVLDTTTGLGYTAIAASRTAQHVVTVEVDPAMLALARLNPWSQELFADKNVTHVIGDSADVVQRFGDASFSRVVHDPPTLSLAGELYGGAFYAQLWRVRKPGGRLFHYVGHLERGLGARVAKGVTRRLLDAGFSRVRRRPEALGLVAYK
jgi:predicted methyltransferase